MISPRTKQQDNIDEEHYVPTMKIAWIIANERYDQVRTKIEKDFIDITPAMENAKTIRNFCLNTLKVDKLIETLDASME